MRILFLTPFLPDPVAAHGGGRYVGALGAAMARHVELGLLHLTHCGEPPVDPTIWSWHRALPYLGSPPAGSRLAHRFRLLWRWRRDPLLVAKYWHPGLPELIAAARRSFAPDAVLVEMAQMAQYLPYLDGLPSVLTDHEAGIPANQATGLGAAADRRDLAMWDRHLQQTYTRASVVQALTDEDAAALSARLGCEVVVRPPALQLPETTLRPAATPARALFLGDFRHEPNRQAARRLVSNVWPAVRRRVPNAELWLAGGNEAPIRNLEAAPGVRVCGYVEDLPSLLAEVRVALAPLWSGAGFRVKTATAFAHGLPVVTNALGARGLPAPPPACTRAESDEDLAAATALLLVDAAAAGEAGRLARAWAEQQLAPERVAALQLQRIDALLRR